jgi:PHD/YefM family antitoxin component YafN of YafNO toxin-antitoxin module/mRNA-degrading endonuclease RelE of RelBE toxin-antitoxin system
MPERLTSTSKARAKLRRLSQTAQKSLDRYIITVRGEPQSVLIGYDEYQSMKAAVELMQRPEVVEDIKAGLKELDEGKGVPLTEMKARVREASRLKETNKLAQELAAESGVDSRIVETVMIHLGEKMMNVLSTQGSPFIPRVGEIDQDPRIDPPGKTVIPDHLFLEAWGRYIEQKGIRRAVKAAPAKQKVSLPKTQKES